MTRTLTKSLICMVIAFLLFFLNNLVVFLITQTHILFCFFCIFSSIFVTYLVYTLIRRKSMIKALFIVSVSGQPRFSKFYEYIVFPLTKR